MKINTWKWAFILVIINCSQFLILTNIAMFFYPGGTITDPNTSGYSLWKNLFSDLGRFITPSGDSNLIAFVLYNISLFLMGALFIPYFIAMPQLFKEKEGIKVEGRGFCVAGSIIGIPIAISMIGASLTPADLLYGIHVSFGFIKFIMLIPQVLLYSMAIFQNKIYPNKFAYIFMIFGVMQLIFVLIMFLSVSQEQLSIIFAAGQNIVVYAMTVCYLIEGYGAWKLMKFYSFENALKSLE